MATRWPTSLLACVTKTGEGNTYGKWTYVWFQENTLRVGPVCLALQSWTPNTQVNNQSGQVSILEITSQTSRSSWISFTAETLAPQQSMNLSMSSFEPIPNQLPHSNPWTSAAAQVSSFQPSANYWGPCPTTIHEPQQQHRCRVFN